jgi:hypothetical protein
MSKVANTGTRFGNRPRVADPAKQDIIDQCYTGTDNRCGKLKAAMFEQLRKDRVLAILAERGSVMP